MRLYHGTNIDFDTIDLSMCIPFKDFGKGFYLTDIKNQAERMAQRKSRRFGSPIVQQYEIDIDVVDGLSDCIIKRFDSPDKEWAEFIILNRQKCDPPHRHPYDIVIGPVADDGVAFVLNRYLEGYYTIEEVAEQLKFAKLNNQYCFVTEKAISHLNRIKS